MNAPQPNPYVKFNPMRSVSKTVHGDYHFGLIIRRVGDYAEWGGIKFSAVVAIIAVGRYIVQWGVIIRRGNKKPGVPQIIGNN